MSESPAERYQRIIREDGRYPFEAFDFLHRGLERSAQSTHGERVKGQPRHVSGGQLVEALRDLAIEMWGPLAATVLKRWNITSTRDFGEMVFLLVENDLMSKQEDDRIEDFDDVYDFDDVFGKHRIRLDRGPPRDDDDVDDEDEDDDGNGDEDDE
jgi:uncharacterized repeat protein (TIGR04138 family)